MLKDHDVSALMAARHADPFGVLGMHVQDGRLWVSAVLAHARTVDVVERSTQRLAGSLQRLGNSDVFSSALPGRSVPFDYQLRVHWQPGAGNTADNTLLDDPYAFSAILVLLTFLGFIHSRKNLYSFSYSAILNVSSLFDKSLFLTLNSGNSGILKTNPFLIR